MLWASIQKTWRETSPYFSYVIYVAKALRYCLHISHDKPAFEGEYLI